MKVCLRCGKDFKSKSLLGSHLKAKKECPIKFLDIGRSQMMDDNIYNQQYEEYKKLIARVNIKPKPIPVPVRNINVEDIFDDSDNNEDESPTMASLQRNHKILPLNMREKIETEARRLTQPLEYIKPHIQAVSQSPIRIQPRAQGEPEPTEEHRIGEGMTVSGMTPEDIQNNPELFSNLLKLRDALYEIELVKNIIELGDSIKKTEKKLHGLKFKKGVLISKFREVSTIAKEIENGTFKFDDDEDEAEEGEVVMQK